MKPLNKVFLITEFGSPFSWTKEYINNVSNLKNTGWYWKIFTPNKYSNLPDNVEVIDMTAEQYAELVEKKLGVKINMFTTKLGVPSVHITDYYVASGIIFEDYIKDFDFWGITNMDVVYGRLSQFIPDAVLENCDVFSDDINTINGVFCLFKNNERVNNLFKKIQGWKEKFEQPPCLKCCGESDRHTLHGTDEYSLTDVIRQEQNINFIFPKYYPLHGHDRLEHQNPIPKLSMKEDGSLWELAEDKGRPDWIHARPCIGREIMYYHFIRTKTWPEML